MNSGQFTAIMAELRAIRELLAREQGAPATQTPAPPKPAAKKRPPRKKKEQS